MSLQLKSAYVPLAVSAVLILFALALLEWVTMATLGEPVSTAGMLTGFALAAGLLALQLIRPQRVWALASVSVLRALTELAISATIVFAIAAACALFLPTSLSERFMQADRATDLIIFVFMGLSILIAARAWTRYNRQQETASAALIEAAQAKSDLAQRERALLESEMLLLRAQIEPHFLWNTLAHLQYLVIKNPAEAARMTSHLIRFLRAAVPSVEAAAGTLGTEVDAVQAYLELMKIRMGERLTIRIDLPEALRSVQVAPLVLQTLAENAIKHGVEPKMGSVEVAVSAGQCGTDNGTLWIEVSDTGIGLQACAPSRGTGLGLRNVRDRLAHIYDDNATLTIAGAPTGGVTVRMEIRGAIEQSAAILKQAVMSEDRR
ncbi:sensor histidine kinase [Actimicrobium antarcticum]|uniref:Histidine kinase domain-containing protein n=1 Tax=Actimicrobium antarcticum TaxID=1051899 RepID=A0ABP7T652_9BURK